MKENDISLNWEKYSWRKFEKICFEYIKTIYSAKFYKTILTQPRNDGGRDIIIKKKDNSYEAWGECKNHKRSIDLSVIGKNVVLALSHKINKAIFFSVTSITYNTKVEILNLSQVYNFDVLFLDGDRLNQEILACKSVARKYFKKEYVEYVESLKQGICIETILSEFQNAESECEKERKQYHLNNGFEIYLYVLIKNLQSVPISNGEIIIDNTIHDECIFYDNSKTIDIPIMEHSEKLYMFSGLVFSPKNNINLPMLKCRFILKNGKTLEQSINIGTIDASDVWRAPYINSQSSIFLATVIRELQEIIPNGYARIFYIRGKSGTGKSRLIKEIENKACELSYKIIHIDFRDQNDVFAIRQLFCKWLCLPNPSDTISFEYQDFCNTIKENIVNEEYQQVLFDFLYCNKCEINTNILEKIFFMRTVDHPAIFTFDNIQEVSKDVQMLLWHISSSCRNRSLPIVFAFSTNTEMRIDEKNLLVSYLDNVGGEHTENYIISYVSCALIKEDAILIMQELLHLNQDTSKYIDSVVNKIGTLPLNILFFSKILAQTTDIFGQAHGKRFIKNSHLLNTKLADFLQDDKNRNNKMSEYICDNYPGHQPLFELIVLFEGNLPTSIAELCGFTMNTIKILCEDLVLRIGNDQTVIQFYNDQLFNYLLSKPLQIPRIFYEIIVDYYEGASEKEEKYYNIISTVYLKALISIGKKERAKSFGNKLLKKYKKLHSNRDVCYVCTQLCSLFSPENEPDEYVKVALIKADFLLERVNLYEAELFYEEIKYVIDTKSAFLSPEIITHFYHRYVNQKLHRGKYMEAIYALDEFESMADLTDDSYYIIHDRYCVAYFNLGNIIEAKKHIDKTIRRANKNNNMMWLSIASSDKAFAYFYNGGNKETIIHFFKQAVESHILIENNDISRDIEIKIQESLYLILREDIADAEKSIQKAINIAEKANYNYLMLPAYNLQAYILAYSKKYESALKVLKKAFSDAIIYENQHALISIYNNLGVIHILNGHNGYDDAIASFRSSEKLLKMHPEWSNDNLKYIGLKYNFQKIENNYIDKIDDKKIFLLCGGYCFLYQ